jgi:hypothetical protein
MDPAASNPPLGNSLVRLLAEVAEAAREIPVPAQPHRLQQALAALALTESRVIASLLDDADQAAGTSI